MTAKVKRREFITLLGGAAAAWPLAAHAQQAATKVRRIGVLMSASADDPDALAWISAFAQGLQERGWSVGGNVRIDYRWGAGQCGPLSQIRGGIGRALARRRLGFRPGRSWVRYSRQAAPCRLCS